MRVLVWLSFFWGASASAISIDYLTDTTVTHNLQFQKTTVGGLSSHFYDEKKGGIYSLSDDKGQINESRFYFLKTTIEKAKTEKEKTEKYSLTIEPTELFFIAQDRNKKIKESLDPESMIRLPSGNFLIGSEGDNQKKPKIKPRFLEVTPEGKWLRDLPIPEKFIPESTGLQKKGIRNNNGFEAMSIAPSGKWFVAAAESSLLQDGPEADFKKGALIRFVKYELRGDKDFVPTEEWAYQADPIQKRGETGVIAGSGISEILFLNESQLLVLERGGVLDFGKYTNDLKLFLVTLDKDQDISKFLKMPRKVKALKKTLVLNFDQILPLLKEPKSLDNLEAMALGPKLPDGRASLLFGSDNNFQALQRTLFILFAINP